MDRPIRILQLAESPYFGGINSHIRAIGLGFRESGAVEIRVVTLPGKRKDRWLLDALEGVEQVAATPNAIRKYVADHGIDVVHTHNYRATLLCANARLDVPLINTCHGAISDRSLKLRAYQWMELRAMRKLRATIAVSNFVKNWLAGRGIDRAQLHTVYNGYERSVAIPQLSRGHFNIDDTATIFLFAGRLVREKGIRDFLKALGGCAGVHGIIVGDGPLREECLAASRDPKRRVHFAGLQQDVAPYLALADAVVLPSRMEALPMSLIEAAAFGKPAIATRVGGVPEVVQDGATGILVDPGDIDQLRAAMLMCRDWEVREDFGAAAQARWQALFRRSRMIDALTEIYREAMAQG